MIMIGRRRNEGRVLMQKVETAPTAKMNRNKMEWNIKHCIFMFLPYEMLGTTFGKGKEGRERGELALYTEYVCQ